METLDAIQKSLNVKLSSEPQVLVHILFFSGLNGHVDIFNSFISFVWQLDFYVMQMLITTAQYQKQDQILDVCWRNLPKYRRNCLLDS